MGEGLSVWDILYLKDEIDTGQYLLLTYGIPFVIIGVIVSCYLIYSLCDWWRYRSRIRRRKE